MSKADGVHFRSFTLLPWVEEACLDLLASTKQVFDVKDLIRDLLSVIVLWFVVCMCVCSLHDFAGFHYDFALVFMGMCLPFA